MLTKIKKLLAGPLPSIDTIEKTAASIDIAALEAALADAQHRRTAMVLDGTVDEILAAERVVDTARIELERGQVALAELEHRRQEAEAKQSTEALQARHDAVAAKVDAAVARIEADYAGHARAIAELAEQAREADEAAADWFEDLASGRTGDLPTITPVAKRLGWNKEFFNPPAFADGPSLPPVGDFAGYGAAAKWTTHAKQYALYGQGQPTPEALAQMGKAA